MDAYREVLTIDDPKRIEFSSALPFRKGQRVEVLVLGDAEDGSLERIRIRLAARGVVNEDIQEAVRWARGDA